MEVEWKGTREELYALLGRLGGVLTGRVDDASGAYKFMAFRLAMSFLSQVEIAFDYKSRRQPSPDGIVWDELRPDTIRRRRMGAADRKAVKLENRALGMSKGRRSKIEKEILAKAADLVGRGMTDKQALGRARAMVEAPYRMRGELTSQSAVLTARDVLILIDTGVLHRAFEVNAGSTGEAADGRAIETPVGSVVVKITDEKKSQHHFGIPARKVPARHFWPPSGDLPEVWWEEMRGAYKRGLAYVLGFMIQRGA